MLNMYEGKFFIASVYKRFILVSREWRSETFPITKQMFCKDPSIFPKLTHISSIFNWELTCLII